MIYYGITIGPIVKTLGMTNTPAGLWTASYMFSYVAKTLLKMLKEKKANILIPYYDGKETSNEVGSYPDHIIFQCNIENNDINNIIKNAKLKIADKIYTSLFDEDTRKQKEVRDFIDKYISIQWVKKDILENQNVLLEMSRLLDHIELSESFVMTDNRQFLSMLFSGDGNTSNSSRESRKYIRNFIVQIRKDSSEDVLQSETLNKVDYVCNRPQVQNEDESLKDIKSICNISSLKDLKITDYYAIVYADGDSMTDLFEKNFSPKNLEVNKEMNASTNAEKQKFLFEKAKKNLNDFSKACLSFTQNAATKIKNYGGVTIYAGGDDLLFIAPLCSQNIDSLTKKRKSIFELCKELSDKFSEDMNTFVSNSAVSMSFGVSISFIRSPLYEALNKARTMLFDNAKGLIEGKNAIAVTLSKASGQSVSVCMSFNSDLYTKWIDFLNEFYINVENKRDEKKEESFDSRDTDGLPAIDSGKNIVDIDMVKSITYTIENYYKLYKIATDKITEDKNSIKNFFMNMTDNSHQESYKTYIERVSELYIKLDEAEKQNKFKFIGDNNKKNTALSGILRLSKFYLEKSNQDKEGKA